MLVPGTGKYIIEEIRTPRDFALIRTQWDDLLARTFRASPCLSYDWLDAWWEAFGSEGMRLVVARGSVDTRLIAAAPLRRQRLVCSGVPVQAVTLSENVHCFQSGFAFDASHDAVLLARALLRHAMASTPRPDIFELQRMPCDSDQLEVVRRAALDSGLRPGRPRERLNPVIALKGDWESYLAQRSKSFRSFLRRAERRWVESGGRFEVVDGDDEGPKLLEQGLALEASGWKGRQGTAILQDAEEQRFYRGLATRLASSGRLRQYALRLDGRLVAWDFCLLDGSVCYALKTTYDEASAALSPGFVLQLLELKHLLAEGRFDRYDMLPPASPFKCRWTEEATRQFAVRLYTRRPRALLARAIQATLVPLARSFRSSWLFRRFEDRIDPLRDFLGPE